MAILSDNPCLRIDDCILFYKLVRAYRGILHDFFILSAHNSFILTGPHSFSNGTGDYSATDFGCFHCSVTNERMC